MKLQKNDHKFDGKKIALGGIYAGSILSIVGLVGQLVSPVPETIHFFLSVGGGSITFISWLLKRYFLILHHIKTLPSNCETQEELQKKVQELVKANNDLQQIICILQLEISALTQREMDSSNPLQKK